MQARDDNALLARCQQGSPLAMQPLVRQYQDELLRTAYLLTGVSSSAITLAATAYLDLFQALPRSTTDRDARLWLLTLMGRSCVAGRLATDDLADVLPLDSPQTQDLLSGGGPQRFHVDDERSRVLAAMDRFDRRTRVALVLAEFSGLDDAAISQITGQPPSDLRIERQRSRDKVAEAAGRDKRQLRGPLSSVATSAPRIDLWERIREPLERIEERNRRRNRLLIGGVAAVAGLVMIVGLVWLFAADAFDGQQADPSASGPVPVVTVADMVEAKQTAEPDAGQVPTLVSPAPPGLSSFTIGIGELPDLQLITGVAYDANGRSNSNSSTLLIDQSAGVSEQLGDAGFLGGISPDGRWLLFIQNIWNDVDPDGQMTITAYDTRANRVAWQKGYESSIGFTQSGAALAVTPEQVYLSDADGNLIALNLPTGLETGRWQLFLPESDAFVEAVEEIVPVNRSVRLYIAPNQRRLYAFIETFFTESASWSRTVKTFNLPGMVEVSSMTETLEFEHNDRWNTDFEFWSALPTFDGRSFYALMYLENEGFVVRFLDLRSNELTDVELPLAASPSPTFPTIVQSNSGQWLYIVHGDTLQVTIVDLLNRRLDRTFPLDGNGFELPALVLDGFYGTGYGPGTSTLSQDGERLYLTVFSQEIQQQATNETIVLVIDVPTWQVTDRWTFSGYINQMQIHPDGELLTALSVFAYPLTPPDQFENYLLTIDRDGSQIGESVDVQTLMPDATVDYALLNSLPDGYKRQYGLAPVVGGVPPADPILESTLPGVEITAGQKEVAAGNAAEIEVRFTDPISGETLTSARPDIRLDLDASVSISLSHSDADPVIVQPVQLDDGSYRAVVYLDEPGIWSATASMIYRDGTQWSTTIRQVVDVIQSFVASDGKRYVPKLTTNPETPLVNEDFDARVEFREIKTGLLIPEDVDLPGGIPDSISLSLVNLSHGATSVTLKQAGHGIYQANDSIRGAGGWSVTFRFKIDERIESMTGGTITVGPLADDS